MDADLQVQALVLALGAEIARRGDLIRLRVDEQRLADIEPSQRDVFAVRLDVLSPEVAGISSLGKRRLRTGDRCVGKIAFIRKGPQARPRLKSRSRAST